MKYPVFFRSHLLAIVLFGLTWTQGVTQEISWHASGKNGAVAAGHADSVLIGLRILERGKTAADAAAATILRCRSPITVPSRLEVKFRY